MAAKSKLEAALESAKQHPMTAKEREAQRRSFVYGNTKIEYDNLTRAMVDEVADEDESDAKSEG